MGKRKAVFVGPYGITAIVRWKRPKRMKGVYGATERVDATLFNIYIDPKQPEKEELDTLIHEMLHAASWQSSESWVAETASGITDLLWRAGYRKDENHVWRGDCSGTIECGCHDGGSAGDSAGRCCDGAEPRPEGASVTDLSGRFCRRCRGDGDDIQRRRRR